MEVELCDWPEGRRTPVDALSKARLGSCCRTPPGTPMHRRCGCDLSAMAPPHDCRRLTTAAVSTTTRSTLPWQPATSGSTHKLRIQAAGGTSTPAAAQPWAPLPRSTSRYRCPTPFPASIRASSAPTSYVVSFTTSRAARAARAERHHRPTGTGVMPRDRRRPSTRRAGACRRPPAPIPRRADRDRLRAIDCGGWCGRSGCWSSCSWDNRRNRTVPAQSADRWLRKMIVDIELADTRVRRSADSQAGPRLGLPIANDVLPPQW